LHSLSNFGCAVDVCYVATARTNKTPYVEQYSLSLGHNFNSKLGGELSYVGNAGEIR